MNTVDDRLRAALRARAEQLTDAALNHALPPSAAAAAPSRRARWIAPLVAAAAVAGIAITVTAIPGTDPGDSRKAVSGVSGTASSRAVSSSTASSSTVSSTQPSTAQSTPATGQSSSGLHLECFFPDISPCKVPPGFAWYVPLWPFAGAAQVTQWEGSGGSQPWHLDPSQTALDFTRSYLGFTDITVVTTMSVGSDEAQIGVGYVGPDGKPKTAAVLHLVRYEQLPGSTSAPWEVVGSDDTTLTLERPAYDSTVGQHFTAGGHITGVDESLTLTVRSLTSPLTFTRLGVPAGGNDAPWSIMASAPMTGTVTVVVSTGGHVQQHERFAIQGVMITPSS